MLKLQDLIDLANARLEEAQILHTNKKYDGAIYLSGYAIELALKSVVLKDKLWGFPEDDEEFKLYQKVKIHELTSLIVLAGKEELLNDKAFSVAWEYVKSWKSEFRYRPPGAVSEDDSTQTLASVHDILEALGVLKK